MRAFSVFLLLISACFYSKVAMASKCMLVMSYHQGYEWNDGVQKGVESVLKDKCELKIFYMDTKRNKSEAHAERMALAAKKLIEEYF